MRSADDRYAWYMAMDRVFEGLPLVPRWLPDGASFWYLAPSPLGLTFHMVDRSGPASAPLLLTDLDRAFGDATPPGGAPFDRIARDAAGALLLQRGRIVVEATMEVGTRRWHLRRCDEDFDAVASPRTFHRQLFLAPPVPVPEVVSCGGTWLARIQAGDVWIRGADDAIDRPLTEGATRECGWDLESGRSGYGERDAPPCQPWSPDDLHLFATRVDRRDCRHVPTIDFLGEDIGIGRFPVETAATRLPRLACYFLHVDGRAATVLDGVADGDAFITPIGWRHDGAEFWFARLSRDFTSIALMAARPDNGHVRTVLVERGASFVRIQHEVLYAGNVGVTLLRDGFLWRSERDGWSRLYRHDGDGDLVGRLTSDEWPVVDVQAVDEARGLVFYTAHGDCGRPYDVHLFSVRLDGTDARRLTPFGATHRISMSPTLDFFTDWQSTVADAPTWTLRDATGQAVQRLFEVDTTALREVGWTPPREFVVQADDGITDLWGVMHLPADFDPSRRYPVVEHIYAGPQVAFASHAFDLGSRFRLWNQAHALAQLGYVVVVIDGRGTPGRSKAFHDHGHGRFGTFEIAEHASAIRQLADQCPWLDLERVGIFGHSWGGYFALRALVDANDLYKAAVASGSDFTGNNFLIEPYLGSLSSNADRYAAYSLLPLASSVRGELMIVAGTDEYPMLHDAMRMTHALIAAGIQHRLVILPGQSHGYGGASADYVTEATRHFFERHLQPQRHRSEARS